MRELGAWGVGASAIVIGKLLGTAYRRWAPMIKNANISVE